MNHYYSIAHFGCKHALSSSFLNIPPEKAAFFRVQTQSETTPETFQEKPIHKTLVAERDKPQSTEPGL